MLLNGKDILAARDKKTATVPVPEWGEGAEVLIGTMGSLDRIRLFEWFENKSRKRVQAEEKDEQPRIVTTDSPTENGESLDGDSEEDAPETNFTMMEHAEFKLEYLVASILDPETYEPAFTAEQIKQLGKKDPKPLTRIFNEATKLNLDEVNAFEDAEKNSGKTTD